MNTKIVLSTIVALILTICFSNGASAHHGRRGGYHGGCRPHVARYCGPRPGYCAPPPPVYYAPPIAYYQPPYNARLPYYSYRVPQYRHHFGYRRCR